MLPNPETSQVTIQDYLRIIKKRIWLILACVFIITTAVTVYVSQQTPMYRATASLLIDLVPPKVIGVDEVYRESLWGEPFLQTQIKLLSSLALAEKVADELRASKDSYYKNIYNLPERLRLQVRIEMPKNTQIVLLSVDDTDPLRASTIANAFVRIYMQQDVEKRNRTVKEASSWLQSQIGSYKDKLREAEEALNNYVQTNKIVDLPDIERKTQGLLEALKGEKSKLETELAEGAKRYKEQHPKIIAIKAQLEDINDKLINETNHLLELNQKLVQYNLLKKEVESSQNVYTGMLSRLKETGIAEKIETSRISVVDYAKPPEFPFKPNKQKAMQMAVIFSLIIGVGISYLLEYLDSSIRTAEDVSSYLNLPFLGYIPSVYKEAKTDSEKAVLALQGAQSQISEAFRAARTSILFATPEDKPLHIILLTSSLPQEGKSFVSSNLSIVFSQLNERVILIDMDMRRPKIHKNFNIDQKPGLSDFLTGGVDLEKIINKTSIPNLFIIPTGTIPPNPSELLSSKKIITLLEDLKGKFNRIIVDSPPVLSVADSQILSNIVDGVVLVVKGASTRLEAVDRAKKKLSEAKSGRTIGVIVNNIAPEKEDKYYYYHYYYSEEGKKVKKK
ncbi:MAG: polysaccharide biosynthesis tyrosine autokinase [Candidatus Omnitrophica bacterium]|nr:polysaccharide biosynthesis tyrosine autokinase [Candidatus Omnitrophota bacterium]